MKVLLVNGSPHREGCTYTALTEVAATLEKEGITTEIFWIGNQPIGGCIGCRACKKSGSGRCAFDPDGPVDRFLAKAGDFDGFIFGTPVHYAAAAGSMTSFMDRVFYAGGSQFYLKPAGLVISARRAGTTATWDQMNKYFGILQMPIISSRYWNMVHGNTPEEVRQDLEGMQVMRILGRNMAWFLKCKAAGEAAGVPLPEQEETVFTNFIH